jgi:hypothetical protein
VYYHPSAGANRQRVRSYEFAYSDPASPPIRLTSVRQVGADGVSTLPATTFTYYYDADHLVGWKSNSNNGTCGWSYREQRPFLKTVNNGYDGQAQFDYAIQ